MCSICAGRAGSTFGNPGAAGRGDTSAQTQFTKAAGDATKDTLGKALGGDPTTQARPPQNTFCSAQWEAVSPCTGQPWPRHQW